MDCFILEVMQYMLHGGNGGMGVGTCRGCRFYWALCETDALRGLHLDFFVFTGILFSVGPPGAISFFA